MQLRGVHWWQGLKTCLERCPALVSSAQLYEKIFPGHLNSEILQKIIKFREIALKTLLKTSLLVGFWVCTDKKIMPVDLVPLTSVMTCCHSVRGKSCHFSPWISHFFTDNQTSYGYTDLLKLISEGSMVEYLSVG